MRVLWFSFLLLLVDQASKTLVYVLMVPGQSIPVIGDLLKFTFTTNPGMAFGLELGPKLFLSVFSIVATLGLIGYLWMVRGAPLGYRLSLAAVIGGATGNVIDRTFYGVFYGHGPLFHGEVIDFIHVDLWRGFVDLPVLGTQFIPLFPIWNVADMAIVLGVVAVIITQGQLHRQTERLTRERENGLPAQAERAASAPDDEERAVQRDRLSADVDVRPRMPAHTPPEDRH
jgi:signal peptidase II